MTIRAALPHVSVLSALIQTFHQILVFKLWFCSSTFREGTRSNLEESSYAWWERTASQR